MTRQCLLTFLLPDGGAKSFDAEFFYEDSID